MVLHRCGPLPPPTIELGQALASNKISSSGNKRTPIGLQMMKGLRLTQLVLLHSLLVQSSCKNIVPICTWVDHWFLWNINKWGPFVDQDPGCMLIYNCSENALTTSSIDNFLFFWATFSWPEDGSFIAQLFCYTDHWFLMHSK